MIKEAGAVATTPQEVQTLQTDGWTKCRNPVCDYWLSPQEVETFEEEAYMFTCPRCKKSYPLLDPTAWRRQGAGVVPAEPMSEEEQQDPIGIANRNWETMSGLSRDEMGELGEEVVKNMGEIPGYGPLTWWHEQKNDPLDGAVKGFGVEVKANHGDVQNKRFIPGGRTENADGSITDRREDMIARAKELGFDAILGVLVILDFRRSLADIYTREMPLAPWKTNSGRMAEGPIAFRHHQAEHLAAEVPFDNPFLNPESEQPEKYNLQEEPQGLGESLTTGIPGAFG